MPTTPNMSLVLPTEGASSDVWDTLLNAAMTLVDLHDHATGKGVKVTPSGLNINADLSFVGNAATNVKALAFSGVASYATNKSIYVDSDDNELYWLNNAGVAVKMTSGNALNLSLVGGIYGDYSTTSAKVYYEDAGKRYKMLQSGPAPDFWASVDCGDLKLYEKASSITNAITLKSPAALAASYSVTLPGALPGSTMAVQASAAGLLTFSNTFSTLITASAGVTCAANQHVTVSGTGRFKHGTFELPLNVSAGQAQAGTGTYSIGVTLGAASTYHVPVPLIVGARVTGITVYYQRNDGSTMQFGLRETDGVGGSTLLAEKDISAGAGNANTDVGVATTTGSLPQTIATGKTYVVSLKGGAGAGNVVWGVNVSYDFP